MLSQSISTSSSSGGDSQNNLLPKPHSHAYPFFHAAGLYGRRFCVHAALWDAVARGPPQRQGWRPVLRCCRQGRRSWRCPGAHVCPPGCAHRPWGERHHTATLQLLLRPCFCKPDEEYFAMITNNWWCASLTLVLQGLNNSLFCASKVEL